MAELRSELSAIGFEDVQTYIQSGNVVFQSRLRSARSVSDKIESTISSKFGFQPRVLVVDRKSLQNVVKNNPFPQARPNTLHVGFLTTSAVKPDFESLDRLKSGDESYKLVGKSFYLHAPDGIGRSKMAAAIEKCLGVPTTSRNWNTVNRLLQIAEACSQ